MDKVSVTEVISRVKEIVGEVDKKVDLVHLFNIVEVNLVQEVIKLKDTVVVKVNDQDEILVSAFPKRLLSIVNIYYDDRKIGWGYHLDAETGDGISVPGHKGKEVTVEYHYSPDFKEEDEDSDLPTGLFDLLVYGVISEYFLLLGDFENAKWYERKYRKIIGTKNKKKFLKRINEMIGE